VLVSGNTLAPLLLLVLVVAVDVWVFRDAEQRADAGEAVVATVGPLSLSTPQQWLVGCVFLWVFVVPLYLTARRAE
jgi:uncharacterized membrane protein